MNDNKEEVYVPLMTVPASRYEELTKKEVLLHQIQNAVSTVESYNLQEAISLILSVLPR